MRLLDVLHKRFQEGEHPRHPAGSGKGGEFAPKDELDYLADPTAWVPPPHSEQDTWQDRVQDTLDELGQGTHTSDIHLDRSSMDIPLTQRQASAIEEYIGNPEGEPGDSGRYNEFNDWLREHRPGEPMAEVLALESVFQHAPRLTRDTLLFRGVDDVDGTLFGDLKPGDEIVDRGFASASSSHMVAKDFGNVLLVVRARKGTPLLPMHEFSSYDSEKEFLFAPDTPMRVVHVEQRHGIYQNVKLVFVEVDG